MYYKYNLIKRINKFEVNNLKFINFIFMADKTFNTSEKNYIDNQKN